MSFSVNTNASSLSALRVLQNTQRQQQSVQTAINTGLKVATAKDNSAIFSMAQKLRGEIAINNVVEQSMLRGLSIVEVALVAGQFVSDLILELKEKAIMLADFQGSDQEIALIEDYNTILKQITSVVDNAQFNGVNLLKPVPASLSTSSVVALTGIASGVPVIGGLSTVDNAMYAPDVNGDGKEDLRSQDKMYISNGDGSFTETYDFGFNDEIVLVDFNNDGIKDAVNLDFLRSSFEVSKGNGDGTFTFQNTQGFTLPTGQRKIEVGDLNGDGNQDVLLYQIGSSTSYESYLGDGNFNFVLDQQKTDIFNGDFDVTLTHDVELMDANNDGADELFIGAFGKDHIISYTNDGNGVFTESGRFGTTSSFDRIEQFIVEDVNGDDVPELIGAGGTKVYIYGVDGNGGLILNSELTRLDTGSNLIVSDFNNDGNADLSDAGFGLLTFNGDGIGNFSQQQSAGVYEAGLATVIDFNGDGIDDVITRDGFVHEGIPEVFSVLVGNGKTNMPINHQPMTLQNLGLSAINSSTNFKVLIQDIEVIIQDVSLKLGQLGISAKMLESNLNFNRLRNDTLNIGLGNLVDADMGKESAVLQALQVKEQLGLQALSIANNAKNLILNLFDK